MTVGGKEGVHINYTKLENVQYQLNGGSGSFAQVYNAGGRYVSIAFDAMRFDDEKDVPYFYFRSRSSSATGKKEVNLIDFVNETATGIKLLGSQSEVRIDTEPHRYEFVFDLSNCNPTGSATKGYIIGHILVDGVVKFTTSYDIDASGKEYIQNWTNDGYASFRFQGRGGEMWFSNFYAGPTQNAIAYKNADVPATAPATYTTGVKTDLPAPVLEDGKNFLGWYADPGYEQQIDAIPANAIGLYMVYAKVERIDRTASYDFSNVAEVESGFCANHVDGDTNAICDNCGFCINTCTTSDNKAGNCTVCGQYLTAHTIFGSLINSKDARNNYYLENVTKKDAKGNDVAGTVYALSSQTNSDTPFGTIAGSSYAACYNNGATAVYYDFTMARAFEDGDVTQWYPRVRTSDKKDLSPFGISKAGEIIVLSANSGVMLDMVARTYRIIIDISDGADQILTGYLYVDGVLAFETTFEMSYPITSYTYGDQLSQMRLASAGAIWFAKIEAGTMVR